MDKSKNKSTFTKIISSESFIEKIILLILTVLLSGLLIPYVTNEIQRTKSKNEVVIQAQSKLLDDVSKTLLTYETLLADISWFKLKDAYDEKMHQKAFEKYSDRAVDLLAEWRLLSARARTLASPEVNASLDSFQLKMFRLQDGPINNLHKRNASNEEWQKQHQINVQMLTEANSLVTRLAKDMNITKDNIK